MKKDNKNIEPLIEDAVLVEDESTMAYTSIQLAKEPINVPDVFNIKVLGEDTTLSIEAITALIEQDKSLVINGHLDKENYQAVEARKKFYLKSRTTLEKEVAEKIKKPAKAWLATLDENVDKLSKLLKSGEEAEAAKLKEQDDYIENERKRKAEEAEAKAKERTDALTKYGASYNPNALVYTFSYDAGLIINTLQLEQWGDEEFNLFIGDVKTSYDNEQARLKEEKDKADAEIAKNQELASQTLKLRAKVLRLLGATELDSKQWYIKTPHYKGTVTNDYISNLSEAQWDAFVDRLENGEPETPAIVEEVKQVVTDSVDEVDMKDVFVRGGFTPVMQKIVVEDTENPMAPEQPSDVEKFSGDVLVFWNVAPFFDQEFPKTILRLFPDHYAELALQAVTDIIQNGKFSTTDHINYILFKKPAQQ